MPRLLETIAENLKRFRQNKGLTQHEFADLAGIKRGTVARYESGEGGIDAKTIETFARTLGIEETDLAQLEKKPDPQNFHALVKAVNAVDERVAIIAKILNVQVPLDFNKENYISRESIIPDDILKMLRQVDRETRETLLDGLRGALKDALAEEDKAADEG